MSDVNLGILASFVRILPQLAIFIACIFYLSRKRTADAILLTIGSFIGTVVNIFYSIIWPFFLGEMNLNLRIHSLISPVSFIGSIVFVTGFFMLIVNVVKAKE